MHRRTGNGTSELLLAENDSELRHVLASVLRGDGHSVFVVRDRRELADRIDERSACLRERDLIVADVRMDGALELLEADRTSALAPTPILAITTQDDPSDVAYELRRQAALFELPLDLGDLRAAARTLLPVFRTEVVVKLQRNAAVPAGLGRRERCTACKETTQLLWGASEDRVVFCTDCLERAVPAGPHDELGGSG